MIFLTLVPISRGIVYILNKGYENALLLVTKAIDKIMIGGDDIVRNDLVVSKLLGQNLEKYRSLFPHVSAAIQLCDGDNMPFKVILLDISILTHSTKVPFLELSP